MVQLQQVVLLLTHLVQVVTHIQILQLDLLYKVVIQVLKHLVNHYVLLLI